MTADLKDFKKENMKPRGLRKLAPNDFDEEMSAIKNGLHHVAKKFQKSVPTVDGQPIPVDQVGKRSPVQTFAAVTRLIKNSLPDAAERSAHLQFNKKEKFTVNFEQEEEVPCEKTIHNEQTVVPDKISATANKAKEVLKNGTQHISGEKNHKMGRIAAGAAAEGFGTAFHGVAEGARAIRRTIENKFPKTNRIFKAIDVAARTSLSVASKVAQTTGKSIVSAGRGTGEKLKKLKNSETFENAKNKLSQSVSSVMNGISQKGKNVSEHMSAFKKKTSATLEELRTAHKAAGTINAEEKLKALSEKAASCFKDMYSQISEKVRKIAADAKNISRHNLSKTGGINEGKSADKFRQFADKVSEKAKGMAQHVRAKAEKFVCDDEEKPVGEIVPLSEKLRDLKDKMMRGAKDLAAKSKNRFDTMRAPKEESPENPPVSEVSDAPSQSQQPDFPAYDNANDYTAEEAVTPDIFPQKDDKKQN